MSYRSTARYANTLVHNHPDTKGSVPSDGPIFMQMFALTMFKAFPPATPYQTAIFLDFFGSLADHHQPHSRHALSNHPPPRSMYTVKPQNTPFSDLSVYTFHTIPCMSAPFANRPGATSMKRSPQPIDSSAPLLLL